MSYSGHSQPPSAVFFPQTKSTLSITKILSRPGPKRVYLVGLLIGETIAGRTNKDALALTFAELDIKEVTHIGECT